MVNKMNDYKPQYLGALTREQFLYYEVKIVAQLINKGYDDEKILSSIIEQNLFQLPTEKSVKSLSKGCINRLRIAGTPRIIQLIAEESNEISKQASLYLLMRYNKIVWDFMIYVIGEKYKNLDLEFNKNEVLIFLNKLQLDNDIVASWSDSTINKIRTVLIKILSDTGYLDNIRSTKLNNIILYDEVLECIKENNDYDVLSAFNYFN